MNAKTDSGRPPHSEQIKVKEKKESIVNTLTYATLEGVNAHVIEFEATFRKGLPGFSVVGLVSSDIQEAKESVNNHSLLYSVKDDLTIPKMRIAYGFECL